MLCLIGVAWRQRQEAEFLTGCLSVSVREREDTAALAKPCARVRWEASPGPPDVPCRRGLITFHRATWAWDNPCQERALTNTFICPGPSPGPATSLRPVFTAETDAYEINERSRVRCGLGAHLRTGRPRGGRRGRRPHRSALLARCDWARGRCPCSKGAEMSERWQTGEGALRSRQGGLIDAKSTCILIREQVKCLATLLSLILSTRKLKDRRDE